MILTNGFSIINKTFETRTPENPFFRKKLKHRGEKFYSLYRFLLAAANVGNFKGLERGWLRISYREMAEHVGVSLRTILNYLQRLEKLGFILLKQKVNKERCNKTELFLCGYPNRKKQSKQELGALYIEKENKKINNPLPPKGDGEKQKKDFASWKRDREQARNNRIAATITKRLGNSACVDETSAKAILGSPELENVVVAKFGSISGYYDQQRRWEKDYIRKTGKSIHDRTGFFIHKLRNFLNYKTFP